MAVERAGMKRNRYHSEASILRKIDAAKDRIVECLAKAESCEDSARTMFRSGDEKLSESAALKQDEARKLRVKAKNITQRTLPFLGQKLAVFRTAILPGVDMDPSVPVK